MTKIMVVDDDEKVVDLLRITLESEGYEVIPAFDGEDAIKKIENERPDLILLDIMMPKIDGWEVCRKVKDDRKLRTIPVVMLTAKTQPTDRLLGIHACGADDYITKPFEIEQIVEKVKDLLKRE